jgi:hypothetical protein
MSKKTILCSRGTVYESQFNPQMKDGMFALFPPLISPVTPIIINGAEIQKSDIVAPEVYLGNKKTLFTFGQAWGRVTIQGEILLGSVDFEEAGITTTVANGLRIVETYFSLFRSSVYSRPIILSALRYAKPIKFHLTGYTRGAVNAEFNTIAFNLIGAVVDKQASGIRGAIMDFGSDLGGTELAIGGSALGGLL